MGGMSQIHTDLYKLITQYRGKLDPEATVRYFRTVQKEDGREVVREFEHYNLGVALRSISGYKEVNS